MYPSEYAYRDDSIIRAESASANCSKYPGGYLIDYIHCDGTQLKLADSDLGQGQYQSLEYYQWSAWSNGKLLFIFPARDSLTTITLYYYSDSVRSLPRLRFHVVQNDFDVWDAPTTSHLYVEVAAVPLGEEPAGCRNVSINVNFNTKKVLMYKFRRSFQFAVSEVQFFKRKKL